MAMINGTLENDFIHIAGDGLNQPSGHSDKPFVSEAFRFSAAGIP